ncbi:MAG: hypothetical protein ACKOSO_03885, partial [Actinomycetota bacterium]
MPIRISQGLLVGLPGADPALLERDLWARSGGACALCAEPMDPAGEELEAAQLDAAAVGQRALDEPRPAPPRPAAQKRRAGLDPPAAAARPAARG